MSSEKWELRKVIQISLNHLVLRVLGSSKGGEESPVKKDLAEDAEDPGANGKNAEVNRGEDKVDEESLEEKDMNVENDGANRFIGEAEQGEGLNVKDPNRAIVQTPSNKRLVTFVRGWKDHKNDNYPWPSIIQCNDMDAKQRDCYRVVCGRARVGDQYIRMASLLYTKSWVHEYGENDKHVC
ncbi:uncharacterized protein LOC110704451 [Chenopodium quinoa]|uniref:uncharacterized protein LOC110704451 n=1 Tax=Chenopodium quinoa TaxID=63459 RepID=UPI000B76C99A|nr:uncharacterized protein LOC110704451 [Chenopodium quinoa]